MATRGTAYLLMEDDCVMSVEFNGDMYPTGHGDDFFKELSAVKSELEFIDFIEKFNKENFEYEDDLVYSVMNKDYYDKVLKSRFIIDFNNEYFQRFFSDWIFFKNFSGKPIRFITQNQNEVILKNGNSCRFNFGCIPSDRC